jgi:hypothetical protein
MKTQLKFETPGDDFGSFVDTTLLLSVLCLSSVFVTWCSSQLCPIFLAALPLFLIFLMDNRVWIILFWNIRGLNASGKWEAVRNKLEESACSIVCLQETKRDHFDMAFIKNFAPRHFDCFDFVPADGASGGLLTLWSSSCFHGTVTEKEKFCLTVIFSLLHNGDIWTLSNIYGPCVDPDRSIFVDWFRNCDVNDSINWLFWGDFNFYRSVANRNRPGGNIADTLIFKNAIGHLGLIELPIKGRAFTWNNMQSDPLLEQLDWFFTSPNWTLDFPMTEVYPMAQITSDHVPCRVSVNTRIPKSNVFRFENFWAQHVGFLDAVQDSWLTPTHSSNSTRVISAKFKRLRYSLRNWSKNLSNLSLLINNCNTVILFLDSLENVIILFNPKANLRLLVKHQLKTLLDYKNRY